MMNKKIEELALQAGGSHFPRVGGKNLEKFTELIVKETMQVVANNLPQNTYLDVADAVIEHFAVEE
jgi:hypothetical protein